MNSDPNVMRFFAAPFTRAESDEFADRYNAQLTRDGFTMFAAEYRENIPAGQSGPLAGVIGMQVMRNAVPNLAQPAVELGWRLASAFEGRGLATEGARACIAYAFGIVGLKQLVAVTAPVNTPSRRVMEKLGMTWRPELTYDDARVPQGHPLQQHVLYSLDNPSTYNPSSQDR